MSEDTGNTEVAQTTPSDNSESTAAAAAFAHARGGETKTAEPIQYEQAIDEVLKQDDVPVDPPKMIAGKTEAEVIALLAEIPAMRDGYRKQIDNLAGNYGKLNAAFQKLQMDTPNGEAVTVTDEDLKEMQDFDPGLAGMTKAALNNVLKRINLRGASSVDPAAIDERVSALVNENVSRARIEDHKALIDGLNPGWKEIIGLAPDGKILDSDYRKWLTTQPAEYQQKINLTNNAFEISSSIKTFQEAQAAIAKKQAQNKQRLTNAVQPTGTVAARGAISEQQAADAAFQRERHR